MKKVLFFIPTLGHGGAERVLVNLVNHMDQTKFDITVQTMFDVGIYKNQLKKGIRYKGGLKHYFRGNTVVFKLFSPKFLFKKYIKEHYDIIVSYLEGPSCRVVSGCTDKETKLIAWIHTEFSNINFATKVFKTKKEAIKCYEKFDKTICVASTVRENFTSLFPSVKNVDVLYNTVESNVILDMANEPIEDIIFSKDKINIVSVGKLIKVKGFDRLIKISKKLIEKSFPVHFYLVGKGEEKPNLERLIEENNVKENWTFIGFKTNPYKYVKNADLYVCSSYKEGFSTAVTEALIVGTPVVSTNCSGAKELLGENNEYGIVTENNENALLKGLEEMLLNKGLLAKYAKKAKERGKKFNVDKTVEAVENMLMEVLG